MSSPRLSQMCLTPTISCPWLQCLAQITVLNIRNAKSVFFRKLLGTQENLYKICIVTERYWNSKQTCLEKEKILSAQQYHFKRLFPNTSTFQILACRNKDNCKLYGACKKSFYYVISVLVAPASCAVSNRILCRNRCRTQNKLELQQFEQQTLL